MKKINHLKILANLKDRWLLLEKLIFRLIRRTYLSQARKGEKKKASEEKGGDKISTCPSFMNIV